MRKIYVFLSSLDFSQNQNKIMASKAKKMCFIFLLLLLPKNRLQINAEAVLEDVEFKNFLRRPTMVGARFRHSLILFYKGWQACIYT